MKRLDPPFIRSTIKKGYVLVDNPDNPESKILKLEDETYDIWEVLVYQGKKGEEVCPRETDPRNWKPHYVRREDGTTSVDPKDQNWRSATPEETEYYFNCLEKGEYTRLDEIKEEIEAVTESLTQAKIRVSRVLTDRTPDGRVFKRILLDHEPIEEEEIPEIKIETGEKIEITEEDIENAKNSIWCKIGEW